VTLAVVAVLSALLFPAFGSARDMARRLMRQNNLRVHFAALVDSQADGSTALAPRSLHSDRNQPQQMARLTASMDSGLAWDGLGQLWAERRVSDPRTFYCPMHEAEHTFEANEASFRSGSRLGRSAAPASTVEGNYHYWLRWQSRANAGQVAAARLRSENRIWASDGVSARPTLNHGTRGCNAVFEDGNVSWIGDRSLERTLLRLPTSSDEVLEASRQKELFDEIVRAMQTRHP